MFAHPSRFFRNPRTGDLVVAQMPNIPLWIYLAATATRLVFRPGGTFGTLVSIVATASILVWAAAEVARGDSPFRRVLGAVVLVMVVAGLLMQ